MKRLLAERSLQVDANLDLRVEICLLSERFLRFGYRPIHALLKAQGWQVNLKEVQVVIELWREHYNSEQPHSALGYLSSSGGIWGPTAVVSGGSNGSLNGCSACFEQANFGLSR
jgi:hypothetical protein